MVRCSACENKYRIKSAHFEREVHTGPRTLDESDTVLRSDSVDIDPDEVAPVSIDDDGNVVGLSGLSELMRFSDEQGDDQSNVQANVDAKRSKDKAKARQQTEEPLPVAKAIKPKAKQDKPSPAAKGSGRLRAQALKRKKRNQQYILLGCGAAVLIILGLIIAIIIPNDSPSNDALASDNPGTENTNTDDQPTPPVTDTAPDPKPKDPTPPDEVLVFSEDFTPSPNPAVTFQPPWKRRDTGRPPTDVPTVLTPAMPMSNEGWYVMTPPRGAADAPGDSNVELGQITATQLSDGQTLLAGDVSNDNTQFVLKGELHIMLLDSTGNVFAETYAPLSMIKAKGKQPIALTIPTRYWKRNRGVRAGVQVTEWASEIKPMQGVQLDPIGQGPFAALRLSAKHLGNKPLRNVKILISATDKDDNTIASFLLEEESLYIPQNHWLDLVIATPLPADKTAASWSAVVLPK